MVDLIENFAITVINIVARLPAQDDRGREENIFLLPTI